MSTRTISLLLYILTVLSYFLYAGYFFLSELASVWCANCSTPRYMGWSIPELFIPFSIVFFVLLAGSLILSLVFHSKHHRGLALLSLAYLCFGIVFLNYAKLEGAKSTDQIHNEIDEQRVEKENQILSTLSKDYVYQNSCVDPYDREYCSGDPSFKSFLTYDKENSVLIRVDTKSGLDVIPFGKIDGTVLKLVYNISDLSRDDFYSKYINSNHKSIFDNFTVRFEPPENLDEYHLERFESVPQTVF